MLILTLLALTTPGLTTALPSLLKRYDPLTEGSLTYCSPNQLSPPYISTPCTETSSPNSTITFEMPYYTADDPPTVFAAHYICWANTSVGYVVPPRPASSNKVVWVNNGGSRDRYLADHPSSGQNPCWVTSSLLGPLPTCPNPVPDGYLCGCDKSYIASCCELKAAGAASSGNASYDLNGFLDEYHVQC